MKYLVGTMIEIPRAAITADEIAKEAGFFSFGTNDLTQMTFGFSRDLCSGFLNRRLGSRQTGDGHAEGGAGHIVQPGAVAELHAGGIADQVQHIGRGVRHHRPDWTGGALGVRDLAGYPGG